MLCGSLPSEFLIEIYFQLGQGHPSIFLKSLAENQYYQINKEIFVILNLLSV